MNEVDECCYRHDRCLASGRHPCECDFEFMNCLEYKRNPHTEEGRNAALMYDFMKLKTWFTCGGWPRR
ncbi:phospholipase [Neobacillus mesonae]|nr:phospholipase [Neobacillus mesonae]